MCWSQNCLDAEGDEPCKYWLKVIFFFYFFLSFFFFYFFSFYLIIFLFLYLFFFLFLYLIFFFYFFVIFTWKVNNFWLTKITRIIEICSFPYKERHLERVAFSLLIYSNLSKNLTNLKKTIFFPTQT